MKKYLLILIVLLMSVVTFSLVACAGGDGSSADEENVYTSKDWEESSLALVYAFDSIQND